MKPIRSDGICGGARAAPRGAAVADAVTPPGPERVDDHGGLGGQEATRLAQTAAFWSASRVLSLASSPAQRGSGAPSTMVSL